MTSKARIFQSLCSRGPAARFENAKMIAFLSHFCQPEVKTWYTQKWKEGFKTLQNAIFSALPCIAAITCIKCKTNNWFWHSFHRHFVHFFCIRLQGRFYCSALRIGIRIPLARKLISRGNKKRCSITRVEFLESFHTLRACGETWNLGQKEWRQANR